MHYKEAIRHAVIFTHRFAFRSRRLRRVPNVSRIFFHPEHLQDQPDVCRRLLQHGKHTKGDAGRAGGAAVLHTCYSDQPRVCGRSQQPGVNTQGAFLILTEGGNTKLLLVYVTTFFFFCVRN